MNLKIVLLLSGELLMGDVQNVGDQTTIQNPLHLMVMPPEQGASQIKVGMMPWIHAICSDISKGLVLNRDLIVTQMDPSDTARKMYQEQTSSVVIASPSDVPRMTSRGF